MSILMLIWIGLGVIAYVGLGGLWLMWLERKYNIAEHTPDIVPCIPALILVQPIAIPLLWMLEAERKKRKKRDSINDEVGVIG